MHRLPTIQNHRSSSNDRKHVSSTPPNDREKLALLVIGPMRLPAIGISGRTQISGSFSYILKNLHAGPTNPTPSQDFPPSLLPLRSSIDSFIPSLIVESNSSRALESDDTHPPRLACVREVRAYGR